MIKKLMVNSTYDKVIVCFFLIFTWVSIRAQASTLVEKKITIKEDAISLNNLFREIKKQTNIIFSYNNDQLNDNEIFNIDVKDYPLKDLLSKVFANRNFNWIYKGEIVVIKMKSDFLPSRIGDYLDSLITVSGYLKTQKGEPIPGATIAIKGTKQGALTNDQGYFQISQVSKRSHAIISSIGFTTIEMTASEISVNQIITLKPFVEILDEKIITAYSTTTQRTNVGGSIGVLRSKDIEKKPVTNPLLALQGEIPGVVVEQVNGISNGAVTVRIRGQISMGNGNDPLFVVDGVPFPSQLLSSSTLVLGTLAVGQNSSPLSFLNPSDIESISVLKDADATSIYGSRAAAGAILITTKKGKEGPTKIDVNFQDGWGNMTRRLKLMNSKQYLEMRHEAKNNDGANIFNTDYDLNGTWDTTRNTNWQDVFLGGTARYSNYQVSASGGNTNTQYLIGGSFHKETSIFSGSLGDQKGSVHFNITNLSFNQRLNIQLSGNYQLDNNNIPSRDLTDLATTLAPVAPKLYNADGSLNWAPRSDGVSTWTNPLSYLLNKSLVKTNNLISNIVLSYQVLPSLNFKVSGGYTNLQTNEVALFPLTAIRPERRPNTQRRSIFNNGNINSWIVEPQINYTENIGIKGKLEFLVGSSIQQNNSTLKEYTARGFTSDLVMEDILAASSIQGSKSLGSVYKYNALFGALNYNWNTKYFLKLSARRDGSSRFGSDNQFHNFWSAAGAWIFTNEKLIEKAIPFLTYGKVRASYGTTGNDQIGDYSFLSLYSQYSVPVPYQGTVGLTVNSLPNPHLQWEETNKFQMGFDLGFLENQKILLNVDYYRNRSSNQLLNYALSNVTGFSSVLRNFPATVQNSGIELALSTTNFSGKSFNWTTNFNISIPRNKLVSFPNLSASSYAFSYIVGQPVNISRLFKNAGVDPNTGLYLYSDSHGGVTSNPDYTTDANVLINTLPKYIGGLQNSFNYKGIQVDLLFQFVKQTSQGYQFGNLPGNYNLNQPESILNRWQKVGDKKPVQKYSSNYAGDVGNSYRNVNTSDKAFVDGSYIRVKNISISWQVPEIWLNAVHVKACKIYVHAQNLFTITSYQNLDPETKSSMFLPPLRVITAGIQATF